ncbi:amino acid adenylation domain-containing protein [Ectothiorhodospiraceae bacterium BW-2]|nr:amino acid adenylation domain-containing protein [Ectothiorhodospiraceae bacterium BW-2]
MTLRQEISDTRWSLSSHESSVPRIFEYIAQRLPQQTAVFHDNQPLSYDGLNRQANRLAHYLIATGLPPGTPIAVSLEKSHHAVVAFMAVLKAGATYLPLDPDYPIDRINYILDDTSAPILLINKQKEAALAAAKTRVIDYETLAPALLSYPESNPSRPVGATDFSYIIYTSGTTGQPKGIRLTQQTLVNLIAFQTRDRGSKPDLRVSQFASFSFDVSLQELCYTLTNGYTLYVVPLAVRRSTMEYAHYLIGHRITSLFITTSMLELLAEAMLAIQPEALALSEIFVSGETLKITPTIRRLFLRYPDITLINQYGPSESHVMLSYTLPKGAESWEDYPPLGCAIPHFETYVLNDERKPLSVNEIGELYISGIGLSAGYINRPELTAEKFGPNPFNSAPGYERLYQTGDLVQWRSDGYLQHMGRRDFQVKIRGFRIELQEIESVIDAYDGVKQAVVLVKDRNHDLDQLNHSSITLYLVGYFVADTKLNKDDLFALLQSKLPDYMVPNFLVQVDQIPLTHNLKVDRKKLLAIDENEPSQPGATSTAITDPQHRTIAAIWSRLLNLPLEKLDSHSSFFHFGGNSLLTMRLANELAATFQTRIPIALIYEHNSIAALATAIDAISEAPPPIAAIDRHEKGDRPRLSFAQERLWFIEKYEEGTALYNIPIIYTLRADVGLAPLEQAIKKIISRHESLRTLIRQDRAGESYQQVVTGDLLTIEKVQLDSLTDLNQALKHDAHYLFNLQRELPIRLKFYAVTETKEHYLLLLFHHIATDGWSIELFMQELLIAYRHYSDPSSPTDEPNLPALPLQYSDFALWQRHYLSGPLLEKQLDFWRQRLNDFETLNLITDAPRPERVDYRGAALGFELDQARSDALRDRAKALEVSLYSLLMAAFLLMLRLFSHQKDIVIGLPISNRHYHEIENLIGFFVNSLPLRLVIDDNSSSTDYIQTVHRELLALQLHQDIPFEYLIKSLNIAKDSSRHPLFQVMFGLQNFADNLFGLSSEPKSDDKDPPLVPYRGSVPLYDSAKFDLTVFVNDSGANLSVIFNYATALFTPATINSYMDSFEQLLTRFAAPVCCTLATLDYITPEQLQQITVDWNRGARVTPFRQTVDHLFTEQVKQQGDRIALCYQHHTLTYQQLDSYANQLANYLQQQHHIGANDRVALFLHPSQALYIAIWAILKAGAAYVPIDLRYPEDRIAYILADTGATLVLVDQRSREQLDSIDDGITRLTLDAPEVEQAYRQAPSSTPTPHHSPDSLAYIIYTSGTTGQPKGVMVPHRSVVAFCQADNYCQIDQHNSVLGYSSHAFDGSVFDIFVTLTRGAKLVAIHSDTLLDAAALTEVISQHHIDTLFITSALFVNYAELKQRNPLLAIKNILFGGEKVSPDKISDFLNYSRHTNLIHVYGPTETIVFATFAPLTLDNVAALPIGKPLADKKLYLLNEQLQPLPAGAVGELYISGLSLAQGYLNQASFTQDKFIPNPFQTAEEAAQGLYATLYKTGDLVRYLPNGDIQYIARNDSQVKIRGYRIELEEIEQVLNSYPGVEQVVVLAKGSSGAKQLVAYLQLNQTRPTEPPLDGAELLAFAQQRLAEYMVPRQFAVVDKIPVNTNGKIDKKRLLDLATEPLTRPKTFIAPKSHYETLLSSLWQRILSQPQISISDNFFDLGGNSILLAQMHAALPDEIRAKIKIIDLFKYPTIAAISQFLTEPKPTPPPPSATTQTHQRDDIAIIGMAGRFPGADSIEELWQNLIAGRESITFYTKEELLAAGVDATLINHPNYVAAQGVLSDIQHFDADFFGYSPREATLIDPQQRLFLACAYHALEAAGYDNPDQQRGPIALYAAVGRNRYLADHLSEPGADDPVGQYQLLLGNGADFLATRVAYKLNLTGPAITVQTACSSSLVAVHQACLALKAGDCDLAMAGGVSLQAVDKQGYLYEADMIGSSDGHCRAFDAAADGTLGGQGVAVVVLKRLSQALADSDPILAVIKGHAINNDGSTKIGFTAPSIQGQAEVIRSAIARAGIAPETLSYIEAHGTGTKLGDPIEIEALKTAFAADPSQGQFCAIGSLKPNIGHLDAASGVAGLIKATLSLHHKALAPTIHYQQSNEKIDFSTTPFYVSTDYRPWPEGATPRRAGVSAFGLGGTNAHVVLEESPSPLNPPPPPPLERDYPIWFSAHTPSALAARQRQLLAYLTEHPDTVIRDFSYTLQLKRRHFKFASYVVAQTVDSAITALKATDSRPPIECRTSPPRAIVFMFPGQGSQYVAMGAALYRQQPYFRQQVDHCFELIPAHTTDFTLEDIFTNAERLHQTAYTQPALFIISYALARYLIHIGVKPNAMIGHSIGEYVAATLSGLFTLKDALYLVTQRARLLQRLPQGAMLSILLPSDDLPRDALALAQRLDLDIAAINDRQSLVLSGSLAQIDSAIGYLNENDISYKRLPVTRAFHSRMVEAILPDFEQVLSQIDLATATLPFISNLSGTLHTPQTLSSRHYWIDHLRHTVKFADGLTHLLTMLGESESLFLEVGAGEVLTRSGRRTHPNATLLATLGSDNNRLHPLLETLLQLQAGGVKLNWEAYYPDGAAYLPLPSYPFESKPFWITKQVSASTIPDSEPSAPTAPPAPEASASSPLKEQLRSIWRDYLGHATIGDDDNFFDLGGDSLLAIRIVSRIKSRLACELALADLFDKPTLRALAQHIEPQWASQRAISNDSSPLVQLQQAADSDKTLFLIHAADGYLLSYRPLIEALGASYTLYGLQNPYLEQTNPKLAPLNCIETIATAYREAIERVAPDGKYHLIGFSLGGLIAYEIAQQLTRSGKSVALLTLIDVIRPDHPFANTQSCDAILLDIVQLLSRKAISFEQFAPLSANERAALIVETIGLEGLNHDRKVAIYNQMRHYSEAIAAYQTAPYRGKVLFFNAQQRFAGYEQFALDETWRDSIEPELAVYDIPGDHLSMLTPPHVADIVHHFEYHYRLANPK